MALKLLQIPFPITAPQPSNPSPNPNQLSSERNHRRSTTELRFSRWNSRNPREFEDRRRSLKEIEDDSRGPRRFGSTDSNDPTTAARGGNDFRSVWTPSSPSRPSMPRRRSKYSKPEDAKSTHRAFTKRAQPIDRKAEVRLSEDGLSYVIDGAPFEFKYSYTEAPKVKPLKLREPPYSPFGAVTMPRPWTGRAPHPPSKKKLKEFDSFQPPPPGKKGVKPVQPPGPFLPGTGPRYVNTREEILGEPLTREEIKSLVQGSVNSRRQMHIGRDGLTHNMLDNIHAHWKRKRVCKIKCIGVCTVDLDNVCKELEQRTGGKIICKKGGVLYLFRGRNYNYRTRLRLPLMLWKPAPPLYPRLVLQAPAGLTLDEASEMRKKGRSLIPIRKLGKNGVYSKLADNIREAFEECELVRINCQGLPGSDFRRIGAKLRDLVPCVLISFENEHILMWRGKDWKSSVTTSSKPLDMEASASTEVLETESPSSVTSLDYEGTMNSTESIEITLAEDTSDKNEVTEARLGSSDDDTLEILKPTDWKRLASVQRVISLLNQAVENGAAIVLDDEELDADIIRKRMVEFSQSATPGPLFQYKRRSRKAVGERNPEDGETADSEDGEVAPAAVAGVSRRRGGEYERSRPRLGRNERVDEEEQLQLAAEILPGKLAVDELAKLLA